MEHLNSINEELELSEVVRHFENTVKSQEDAVHQTPKSRSRSSTPASEASDKDQEIKFVDPTKYTSDLDFHYEDFVKRANPEESPTFREAVNNLGRLVPGPIIRPSHFLKYRATSLSKFLSL